MQISITSSKRIKVLYLVAAAGLVVSTLLEDANFLHFALAFSMLPAATRFRSKQQCPVGPNMLQHRILREKPSEAWHKLSHFSLGATSSSSLEDAFLVDANNLESMQNLFSKYCDADGLMTKDVLQSMPPFAQLLEEGDLLMEEWNDIWDAAPKSPDKDANKVDVDSFMQIYRDVDDLFEDEGDEKDDGAETLDSSSDEDIEDDDEAEDDFETELSDVYQSICDNGGLISKEALKQWEEVQKLLVEGLLGEDEFDELWDELQKTQGESLDVSGFLSFNLALDGLFEFDDVDEEEGKKDEQNQPAEVSSPRPMVVEGNNPPSVLFSQLADTDYLVGMDELKLWVELQDMINEGDLLKSELQDMYEKLAADHPSGKLTEDSFQRLYNDIDGLFVEEDADNEDDRPSEASFQQQSPDTVKKDLLAFLDLINEDGDDVLPCGLDATEADQKQVLNIVSVLQQQPTNLILQKKGNIDLVDVAGKWELIYSSSSAMKFNKGLSGLGGSFPNGRFAGLQQNLKATKFLSDMEYKERIEVNPSSASFDVTVTGSWDLRTSVSLFTGQPSIVLNVEPERVNYGPTSTRADHWKSLGPMNMLDLSYLDNDLRVMRGCTSSDTLFIFKTAV